MDKSVLTPKVLVETAKRVVVIRGYISLDNSMIIHLVTARAADSNLSLVWTRYNEVLKVGDPLVNDVVRLNLEVVDDNAHCSEVQAILERWRRMCPALVVEGEVVVSDGLREMPLAAKSLHFLLACARLQALLFEKVQKDGRNPITDLLWRRLSTFIQQQERELEDFGVRLQSPLDRSRSYPL